MSIIMLIPDMIYTYTFERGCSYLKTLLVPINAETNRLMEQLKLLADGVSQTQMKLRFGDHILNIISKVMEGLNSFQGCMVPLQMFSYFPRLCANKMSVSNTYQLSPDLQPLSKF